MMLKFSKTDWISLCIIMVATLLAGLMDCFIYWKTGSSMTLIQYFGFFFATYLGLINETKCEELSLKTLALYTVILFISFIIQLMLEGLKVPMNSKLIMNSITAVMGFIICGMAFFKHWYKE